MKFFGLMSVGWVLVFSAPVALGISSKFEAYEGGSKAAEDALIDRLAVNFVFVQAGGATNGKLNRGTHSKGVCAQGKFEVLDISKSNPDLDASLLEKLALGIYKTPKQYPVPFVRFANGKSGINKDTDPDVRALSFSVDLGTGKQDYSMNSVSTFPIESLTAFNLFLESSLKPALAAKKAASKESDPAKAAAAGKEAFLAASKAFAERLTKEEQEILDRTKANGAKVTSEGASSYRKKIYWSGTAFKQGDSLAVKYIAQPCDGTVDHTTPTGAGENYLQDEFKTYLSQNQADVCFEFALQVLDAGTMVLNGKKLTATEWVEDPTLDWDAAGAETYNVARLTVTAGSLLSDEACNDPKNGIDVAGNSLPEHLPLGRINRGRSRVEAQSQMSRTK